MKLEEEQLSLLGKMLLYAVDHMTGREREVYDGLVENISRRVSRLQRLERQSERLKRIPATQGPVSSDLDDEPEKKKVVFDLQPHEVVKLFIESWNSGDFEEEYYCLSSRSEKGGRSITPIDDYLVNRKKRWEKRETEGIIRKVLTDISSSEIRGNRCMIHCLETHTTQQEDITLWREYELHYEDGGWRIVDFITHRRSNRPVSSAPG